MTAPAEQYTKLQLDAMTDGAMALLGDIPLDDLQADYAARVAHYLSVQFPDVPELPRIVQACAQYMSAIGGAELPSPVLVLILAATGLRIGGES